VLQCVKVNLVLGTNALASIRKIPGTNLSATFLYDPTDPQFLKMSVSLLIHGESQKPVFGMALRMQGVM